MNNPRPKLNLGKNMAKGRGLEEKRLYYLVSFGLPILGVIFALELLFEGEVDIRGRYPLILDRINYLADIVGVEVMAFVIVIPFFIFGVFLFKVARSINLK
ncbi:MAG: hypothetical protein ACI9H6_000688 [Patiriisocius sp.]|jgi:hypothetical protein